MITDTSLVTALLDEAEAIVEAEWMRLNQDEELWEREVASLLAEMPAPRVCPPRVGTTTTVFGRPGASAPTHPKGRSGRYWPGLRVRATERSPPRAARSFLSKHVVEQRR